MRQIQISEQLYQEILRRAKESGFDGVEDFMVDHFQQEFAEPENFDHLFTPERMAKVQKAIAQVDAGQTVSSEELREHFRRKFNS